MADAAPSRTRSRVLRIAAALGAIAAVAGALKLGGAFDDGDEPVDPAPLAAPAAPKPKPPPPPEKTTIDVGGHPSAIAVGSTDVFVADPFAPTLSALITSSGLSDVSRLPLPAPANSLEITETDLWVGLPGEQAVERRPVIATDTDSETIELDSIPSAIAGDLEGAWVLVESGAERVDAASGEVTEHLSAGGFATALAVDGDAIWIVADNREVRRFDASTLEAADEIAEVPDASAIALGEGYAWVLSSTGALTRLDLESLRRVGDPVRVPGALDLAIAEGYVWVSAADGTVRRVDPASATVVGKPIAVGEDPIEVAAADLEFPVESNVPTGIWVANAGDGTVTRITP
jgi:hypothetical protein